MRESWPWEPLTGSMPALPAGSVRTARPALLPSPRTPHTPPAGQSIDPDTWELWRQRLEENSRARRTRSLH